MVHRINLLFSIKGFDDNGKNGVGQTFQQVLTGNWIEIHDSWMTLSRKNPTPEGDGGTATFFATFGPTEWLRPLFSCSIHMCT